MKNRLPHVSLVASAAALFSLSSLPSYATLTAYEGFASGATQSATVPYVVAASSAGAASANVGSLLNGRPAAAITVPGFTGGWTEFQLPVGVRFSRYHERWALNYSGLLSNNTAGALIYGSDFAYPENPTDANRAVRVLSTPFNSATVGDRFVSFLIRKNSLSSSYIGFEMLNGASNGNSTRTLQVGGSVDTSADTGNWGMRVGNTAEKGQAAIPTSISAQSDVPVVEDTTFLVVLKFSLSASPLSDSITMWVNPASLSSEAGAGAGVTISGIDFAADRIGLASYTFAGHWLQFDEFRQGTAWSSVLPGPSVEVAVPVGVSGQSTLGGVGSPFKYQIFASNRPSTFTTVDSLPSGLSLDSATGVISGTPTEVADVTIQVRAANPFGNSVAFPVAIKVMSALNTRVIVSGLATATGDSDIQSSDPVTVSPSPGGALARDGNTTTAHASDAYYNNRVVVDLGAGNEKFLTGFRFFPRAGQSGRAFAGQVQTSMNGVNWTKLGEIDFNPVAGQWSTVPIRSSALGRYFRYFHPGRSDIAEIEFRTIGDLPTPPVVVPAQSFTITTNESIEISLAADNEPTGWVDSSTLVGNNRLPAGLILDPVTGVVSGSTPELGVFTPSFTASNLDGPSLSTTVTINSVAPALIVYEGFDYNPNFTGAALALSPAVMAAAPVGTIFINQILAADGSEYFVGNGGSGWSDQWKSFSQEPVVSGSLSKNNLLTSGNKIGIGTNGNNRRFPLQGATGVYWMNILMSVQDTTPPRDVAFSASLIAPNDTAQMSISFSFGKFRVGGSSVPNVDLSTVANPVLADGTVHMITVRLNMTSRVMHVWVNATPGSIAPSDAAAVNPAGTNFTPFAFNGVGIGGFDATELVPRFKDEIRVGKTFAQVAPSAFVPSPLDNFRSANGLPANGSSDLLTPANDGVANLLKFAFNMIGSATGQASSVSSPNTVAVPVVAGIAGLPSVGVNSSGQLTITYVRPKASANSGILTSVEFASAVESNSWGVNASASEAVTSIDSLYERVTVTDSVLATPRRFVRVKVDVVVP